MNSPLSEALAPLAARMPRAVRDVEILRVSAQLDGDNFAEATEEARRAVLAWAQKRAGGRLPPEAWKFQEFDLPRGGRNSTAVTISTEDVDLWALRAEDPDKDIAGRVWSTEVVIGSQKDQRPHLSLRLIASTNENNFRVEPHVPGLVLQLIDGPGLIRGARPLTSTPRQITNENDAQDLCDHLEDPERRLPVFVVTADDFDGKTLIDHAAVARATAGFARVAVVPAELSWILTQRFGKFRSVFGGAVREYLPSFSASDDPYRHRLHLANQLRDKPNADTCAASLRAVAAAHSVGSTRLGRDVLDFASVRTLSRRFRTSELEARAAPSTDQLDNALELAKSLEAQLEGKNREIDLAEEVAVEAEDRAHAAEQENRSLLYQVRQLKDALARGGDTPTVEPPLPQEWSEFCDWLDGTYPDRVLLTPGARRQASAPEFEDVEQVARAVTWLATEQFDRRVEGGGSVRDYPIEAGVFNAPCGGDTFETSWKGRSYKVDWHIKNGGNTRNPKKCLRIYYFWEPDTQQTVIAHFPAHVTTSAS